MNTYCELEVEQDKREISWTNTAVFKPADVSPLLKKQIKHGGVFVAIAGECVCSVHATKTQLLMFPIRSSQSGVQDFKGSYRFEFVVYKC